MTESSEGSGAAGSGCPGPRPQPLGALPWPAGMLRAARRRPSADEALAALVAGAEPAAWPAGLAFVRLALAGDVEAAAHCVPAATSPATPGRRLQPGGPGRRRRGPGTPSLAAALGTSRALVGTARFSLGLDDTPPPVGAATGEVAAVVRSARASAALERGDVPGAVAELTEARGGRRGGRQPGAGAPLCRHRGRAAARPAGPPGRRGGRGGRGAAGLPPQRARGAARRAAGDPRPGAAGARRRRPAPCSRRSWPTCRRRCRRSARTPTRRRSPRATSTWRWPTCVMPMSDEGDRIRARRRGDVAAGGAARVHPGQPPGGLGQRAAQPRQRAAVPPQRPPGEQPRRGGPALRGAARLPGPRSRDPLGVARILANQGNALGHLGVFADARERLESGPRRSSPRPGTPTAWPRWRRARCESPRPRRAESRRGAGRRADGAVPAPAVRPAPAGGHRQLRGTRRAPVRRWQQAAGPAARRPGGRGRVARASSWPRSSPTTCSTTVAGSASSSRRSSGGSCPPTPGPGADVLGASPGRAFADVLARQAAQLLQRQLAFARRQS